MQECLGKESIFKSNEELPVYNSGFSMHTYLLHLFNPMYLSSKRRQIQVIKCLTMTLNYIKHFNLPMYRKQNPGYIPPLR